MLLKNQEFPNVLFRIDGANYDFPQLVEYQYLENTIFGLAQAMQEDFYTYQFIIYSRPACTKGQALAPPPRFPKSDKKLVVLYISDELSSVPDQLAAEVFVVFKHFLPTGMSRGNIFPLPLGYNKSTRHRKVIPLQERTYNAFFFGQLSAGRIELYKALSRLHFVPDAILNAGKKVLKKVRTNFDDAIPSSFIRFTAGFQGGWGPDHYAATLYNSKIALCPPGLISAETLRHYEAMRAGCIVITKPLPDHSFYKNAPMIVLEDWSKVREVVQNLLKNPFLMEDLHRRTLRWWNKHMDEAAVSTYMHQLIKCREEGENLSKSRGNLAALIPAAKS